MDELRIMLKQFEAVNTADAYHVGFMTDWRSMGEVAEVLTELQYTHVCPVVWYKQDQNTVGDPGNLTYALEMVVLGRKARSNCKAFTNLDTNPARRHNMILGSTQRKYLVRDDGVTKVNPTQKNGEVYEWFLKCFCKPGDTQVIAGTGAGGEVVPGLEFGCSIQGLDIDEVQIDYLAKRLGTLDHERDVEAANEKERQEQREFLAEEKKLRKLKRDNPPCPVCGCSLATDPKVETDYACVHCQAPMHFDCGHKVAQDESGTQERMCGAESCMALDTAWVPNKRQKT